MRVDEQVGDYVIEAELGAACCFAIPVNLRRA